MATSEAIKFENLTREELIAYCYGTMNDAFTGYMKKETALFLHKNIPSGKALLFVDMCRVHKLNHTLGSMDATNERWIKSFSQMRYSDMIIKYGGDEFVILIEQKDVIGYIDRLTTAMLENEVYSIISVVTTSNDLAESIKRGDAIVNQYNGFLEELNMKPDRDAPYVCLPSTVIYE